MGSPKTELHIQRLGKQTSANSASTALIVAEQNRNSVAARHEDLLYKINSFECFQNLSYQHQCMEELFGRIFTEGETPNSTELLRLLQALSIQAPTVQLPLSNGFTPLIRFDSEKVPYFEFHFFTQSLPLMPPLSGTDFLKTVDKTILDYSTAIFDSMTKFHMWSMAGYPVPVNVVESNNLEHPKFENEISSHCKLSKTTTSMKNTAAVNINFKAIEWEPKSLERHSIRALKPVSKKFPSSATDTNTRKNNGFSLKNNEEKSVSSINTDELYDDFDNESFESFISQEENQDGNGTSDMLSESDTSIVENVTTFKKTMRNRKPVNKEFPSPLSKTSTSVKRGRKINKPTNSKKGKRLSRTSINCKKCNREFSRQFTYIRHINDVHKKEKPFICKFVKDDNKKCGYSCSQEYQAKKHIEKKHNVYGKNVEKYLLVKNGLSITKKKRGRKPKNGQQT